MSSLNRKEWVCLVGDEELAAERRLQAARNEGSWQQHLGLQKPLWRQIEVHATPSLITVRLGNVDEEASQGGYWKGSYAARVVKMTWDDLGDFDFIARAFRHEQVCVMQKAAAMLETLREHMQPIRMALAA